MHNIILKNNLFIFMSVLKIFYFLKMPFVMKIPPTITTSFCIFKVLQLKNNINVEKQHVIL